MSTAVLFSKHMKLLEQRLRMGRPYVLWSKEVKSVGLHIDSQLNWLWTTMPRWSTERLLAASGLVVSNTLKFGNDLQVKSHGHPYFSTVGHDLHLHLGLPGHYT